MVEEIEQKYRLNVEGVPIIYGFWKLKVNIIIAPMDRCLENKNE